MTDDRLPGAHPSHPHRGPTPLVLLAAASFVGCGGGAYHGVARPPRAAAQAAPRPAVPSGTRPYAPPLLNDAILAEARIVPAATDAVLHLGDVELAVERVAVGRSRGGGPGFDARVAVRLAGQSVQLGFSHAYDPTQPQFNDAADGCAMDVQVYCEQPACVGANACGGVDCVGRRLRTLSMCLGVRAHVLRAWSEAPSADERRRGATGVQLQDRLFVREVGYDYRADRWSYVVIARARYRELLNPSYFNED